LIYINQTGILEEVRRPRKGIRGEVNRMNADGQAGAMRAAGTAGFGSVTEALQAGGAIADFLNSPAAAELSGSACGEVLTALRCAGLASDPA
jgi:hypothetical protein